MGGFAKVSYGHDGSQQIGEPLIPEGPGPYHGGRVAGQGLAAVRALFVDDVASVLRGVGVVTLVPGLA